MNLNISFVFKLCTKTSDFLCVGYSEYTNLHRLVLLVLHDSSVSKAQWKPVVLSYLCIRSCCNHWKFLSPVWPRSWPENLLAVQGLAVSMFVVSPRHDASCVHADRTTTIGQLISSYLEKKSDLEDHTVHLLFSANRWELV